MMPNDLSARLRAAYEWATGNGMDFDLATPDLLAAADMIDQQAAEIERLREWERHTVAEGMKGASRYWETRWRDAEADLEKLRKALQLLETRASCVAQLGATPGAQWPPLNSAIVQARIALKEKPHDRS